MKEYLTHTNEEPDNSSKKGVEYIAKSPIAEKLREKCSTNLAKGALRIVEVNGVSIDHGKKPGNKEAEIAEVLKNETMHGILSDNPDFVDTEIENLTIKDLPESYIKLQQRIAREQGRGDIEVGEAEKQRLLEEVQQNQKDSLRSWSDYLRSKENKDVYPDWFKVYTWESVQKMGDFEQEKGRFKKRSKQTVGPFPKVNAEALAMTYEVITDHLEGKNPDDKQLTNIVKNANFPVVYAHFINESIKNKAEVMDTIKGSWKKYDQTMPGQKSLAGELASSLDGHNTGWCTAGASTAESQLRNGDFYVYYSEDQEGEDTIPRIAIRMENGKVAEVRGIEESQNLEPEALELAKEKLQDLPGGDEYFKKAENMKHLTEIENKIKADEELTPEDIMFLQFSGRIEGFGYGDDPRVREFKKDRDVIKDFEIVAEAGANLDNLTSKLIESNYNAVNCSIDKIIEVGVDPNRLGSALAERRCSSIVANNVDKFIKAGIDLNNMVEILIEGSRVDNVIENLSRFIEAGADPNNIINLLIEDNWSGSMIKGLPVFVEFGVDPDSIVNKLIKNDQETVIIYALKSLIEAGANIDPTNLVNMLIEKGKLKCVADNLSELIEAGAKINPTELANIMKVKDSTPVTPAAFDATDSGFNWGSF